MSARHNRYSKQKHLSEKAEVNIQFGVTSYDNELERLAAERNRAYEILEELDCFAKNLQGDYEPVGLHILRIMYGESNV